jgi:release factor glutamine methyltransferase
MNTVGEWLQFAAAKLQSKSIPSARLDSLLLLQNVTGFSKSYILAHPELTLKKGVLKKLELDLNRRLEYEPMAYILGFKEFYGYKILVNRHVLIPRPESESFIDLLKSLKLSKNEYLIDVGTGSGALAIAAAKKFPSIKIVASDNSKQTLAVARQNAKNLNCHIKFVYADLLNFDTPKSINYIFANLPYVPEDYEVSKSTIHEPQKAIFAKKQGLELIKKIIPQISTKLAPDGFLFVESLQIQHKKIQDLCKKQDLKHIKTSGLVQLFSKKS